MISSNRGRNVNTGNPEGSNFGHLLFLIYTSDLPNSSQPNPKLFADDTSLFSAVRDITTSTISLNRGISEISEWAVSYYHGNKFNS